MIVSETDRLILRQFTPDDAPDMFRIYSDPQTLKFLGGGPSTLEEVREGIENHIRSYYDVHGYGLWGTVEKETGRLIGRCGILYQEINGKKDAELAYLFDRSTWGKGFATEAANEIVRLANEKFGFKRMVAVIHPDNEGSVRVAQKCGFALETKLDEYKDFGNVLLYSRPLGPHNSAN